MLTTQTSMCRGVKLVLYSHAGGSSNAHAGNVIGFDPGVGPLSAIFHGYSIILHS